MQVCESLRERYRKYGQDHVFQFLDQGLITDETEHNTFVAELDALDLQHVADLYKRTMKEEEEQRSNETPMVIEPLDTYASTMVDLDSTSSQDTSESMHSSSPPSSPAAAAVAMKKAQVQKWHDRGIAYLREGKAAGLILAGGQGTRLGFDGPKGCYDIRMPSGNSLFQYFVERIRRLESLIGRSTQLQLYIMTSPMNDAATRNFFQRHDYFGLSCAQVYFFVQGTLPCLTEEGKLMLESRSKLARASDGNGGLYQALVKSGALADMKSKGVERMHVFSVDNVLCRPMDPVFLGYCATEEADVGNKVVWKIESHERVGIVAKKNGRCGVVEYSELDETLASKRDLESGKLVFGAANVCNHVFALAFVERVLHKDELPYHIARKKIPTADTVTGETTTPSSPNGLKLEAFIFDVFPLCTNMATLEVRREDEFAPVKNAPGSTSDSPDTARRMLSGQARRWIERSGGTFSTERVIQGEVQKWTGTGKLIKSWKSRHVLLDMERNAFAYFASEQDKMTSESGGETILSFESTSDGFVVQTAAGRTTKWKCKDESDRQKWTQAFEQALASSHEGMPLLCEVSPLVSYAGEGFEADMTLMTKCKFKLPLYYSTTFQRRVQCQMLTNPGTSSFIQNHMMMKSIQVRQPITRPSSGLVQREQVQFSKQQAIPGPVLQPDHVRIEVEYATINPIDIDVILGQAPIPSGEEEFVLGCDFGGTVIETHADNSTDFKIGDRVIGYHYGKCMAEYLVISTTAITKVPDAILLSQATSLSYSGLNAYQGLEQAGLLSTDLPKGDESILILTGKGGDGWFMAQLCRHLFPHNLDRITIVTSEKEAFRQVLGFHHVVSSVAQLNKPIDSFDIICDYRAPADAKTTLPLPTQTRTIMSLSHQVKPDGKQLQQLMNWIESKTLALPQIQTLPIDKAIDAICTLANGTQFTRFVVRFHRPHVPPHIREQYQEAGQEHIFHFYDDPHAYCSYDEMEKFIQQISGIPIEMIHQSFHASMEALEIAKAVDSASESMLLEPLDKVASLEQAPASDKLKWKSLGCQAIAEGKVGVITMAGGQGTRLGYNGPKGCYDIGLPSQKSLFQLFAERLLRLQKTPTGSDFDSKIYWYIMTSTLNDAPTRLFFQQHQYFGLEKEQVVFFTQGMLPCFTLEGKLMLSNASSLAMASNGNGGIYAAIESSGALAHMKAHHVDYVHVVAVDNASCKVADPVFIGYCIHEEVELGNKVVWKSSAEEKVGVVVKKQGQYCVVEYSEMNAKLCSALNPTTGELLYGAGNICNHFFTQSFLERCCSMSLPYHLAHKAIPIAAADGKTMNVQGKNGMKLEMFIFDTFPMAHAMACLSVARAQEFTPVKNAPSPGVQDTPELARETLLGQMTSWCESIVKKSLTMPIEISPLVAYDQDDLEVLLTHTEMKKLKEGPQDMSIIMIDSDTQPSNVWTVPLSLRQAFEAYDQGHVFQFIDQGQMSCAEAQNLLRQLRQLDLASLKRTFLSSMKYHEDSTTARAQDEQEKMDYAPLDEESIEDISNTAVHREEELTWKQTGLHAITQGKVAAVVLAGGQGTRLGFDGPKGCYDIGLPSRKCLFELFALRLLKLQQLAAATAPDAAGDIPMIPWYIMTSPMNDAITRAFFKSHADFGLDPNQVFFFSQGTLPCFTVDGKLILETQSSLACASDGNGGLYMALEQSKALEDMANRGIEYLHVFAVDNAICKVADPVFLGLCISRQVPMGNKVVWKESPEEKVGVVMKKQGKMCVVEYSEMSADMCRLRQEQSSSSSGHPDKLVYGAGNICNHFYTLEFITKHILPYYHSGKCLYHVAHKKIPHVDLVSGLAVAKPTENSGVKIESFIFDIFPLAPQMVMLQVDRELEFAPVKNAPGDAHVRDSPDTARALISKQAKTWIRIAGGAFSSAKGVCEILPTLSYAGEGLVSVVKDQVFSLPCVLGPDGCTPAPILRSDDHDQEEKEDDVTSAPDEHPEVQEAATVPPPVPVVPAPATAVSASSIKPEKKPGKKTKKDCVVQ